MNVSPCWFIVITRTGALLSGVHYPAAPPPCLPALIVMDCIRKYAENFSLQLY